MNIEFTLNKINKGDPDIVEISSQIFFIFKSISLTLSSSLRFFLSFIYIKLFKHIRIYHVRKKCLQMYVVDFM